MKSCNVLLGCAVVLTFFAGAGSAAGQADSPGDPSLAAARLFVQQSDRYMHHSKLKRGMTGFGMSTLVGAKPKRFEVEIVSVMINWGAGQDLILARLSGLGLEKIGVVRGMSGSPVYIRDADGKDKMIGAVAYAWTGQKEPLCGIQPITQMLAVKGVLPSPKQPVANHATKVNPAETLSPTRASKEYLATVLNPAKLDFLRLHQQRRLKPMTIAGPAELLPLSTPLMVSGSRAQTLNWARELFGPMGIVPIRSGGVGASGTAEQLDAKLMPGSPIAVVMVTGDQEWAAIGTVTDVIGDRIIAFGHQYEAEGDLALPMGPAYIHTVVATLSENFVLGSALKINGTLDRDETVAVSGLIGKSPKMISMSVNVNWVMDNQKRTYNYKICRDLQVTPTLIAWMLFDSSLSWRQLPDEHTVTHSVTADFGELGQYRAKNISSDFGVYTAISDLIRPLYALQYNPFGKEIYPQSVAVDIVIEAGSLSAMIQDIKLVGETYLPGETVKGVLTLKPARNVRTKLPIEFQLPADMPQGSYTLLASDQMVAKQAEVKQRPHQFDPQTLPELFAALGNIVQGDTRKLYLRVALPEGGLALGQKELPDLPQSKSLILAEAARVDTHTFGKSIKSEIITKYVIRGSAKATFKVVEKPAETFIRIKGNQQ